MSQRSTLAIILPNEDATVGLARSITQLANPGVCILLDGPVGAGKTYLARAVLHQLMREAGFIEDVPSPTFTLVQTYTIGELEAWHADLYRLTSPDELLELGLDAAFETAFCMIEWPDRMGELAPSSALRITFTPDAASETCRAVEITGPSDLVCALTSANTSAAS